MKIFIVWEKGGSGWREFNHVKKWNRLEKVLGKPESTKMSQRNGALGCLSPSQEIFDGETGEVREFKTDGLNHSWKFGILIIYQDSGSGFGVSPDDLFLYVSRKVWRLLVYLSNLLKLFGEYTYYEDKILYLFYSPNKFLTLYSPGKLGK